MRDHGDGPRFAPRLPPALGRVAFRLLYRGRRLRVEIRAGEATYELLAGEPLHLHHHGSRITVAEGTPVRRPIPAPPRVEPLTQPPGRAPQRRTPG
jgi:alpha,alpha-trehalose phosphorylase